ncbi:TSPc [Musa troglodytarum]|uniref:TSPc n=1 Tax=Musa troglodytarum TaxID=320322 RepID=A0A9E7GCA5_9LILI|nr:TSPc [Musa troglodytarum]
MFRKCLDLGVGKVEISQANQLANRCFVLYRGSPADRAGIHEGDELIEIDGENLAGLDSEAAARKLRGRVGTTVRVKLHSGGAESGIGNGLRENAAAEMENVILEMEDQGVQSYILDLRNNPGGLVKAGLDVAQMWLDGDETLVNTIDREGNMLPIDMVNGHALTHDPLVVLVNEGSASASEILAGALHDNGRAILVGHRTFGKGKIQSVTELHDGSALFITVAKYLSPALHDKYLYLSTLESDSCIMVAEHELEVQKLKGSAS